MAVVIRLSRRGKKKQPHYNIVVQEHESHPQRGYIAKLGYYVPQRNPATLEIDLEQTAHWVKNGAKPSPRVAKLIELAKSGGPQLKAVKNKKFAGKFEKAATEPVVPVLAPEPVVAEEATESAPAGVPAVLADEPAAE